MQMYACLLNLHVNGLFKKKIYRQWKINSGGCEGKAISKALFNVEKKIKAQCL